MKEALGRAAIFLGYAIHSSKNVPLTSVTLEAPIVLDVGMPDPIPLADRKRYQAEFTQWAIGQGLIEIDQSYQRYVVSAIDTLADLTEVLTTRELATPRKPNLANTWTVHKQFYENLGQQSLERTTESNYLRSLGNARNCLAHDSGLVTERRINNGESTLLVSWPGRDTILIDKDEERTVLQRDRSYCVRAKDVGSKFRIKEVVREHHYAKGERIIFSQTDLSEIIFFYQILAMKVSCEMHRIVGEKQLVSD